MKNIYWCVLGSAAVVLAGCGCPYELNSDTSKAITKFDSVSTPSVSTPLPSVSFSAPGDHVKFVREVVGDTPKGQRCLLILQSEQYIQDVAGVLSAPVHFDNCTFNDGLALIATRTEQGDNCVNRDCMDQALGAYGAAVHTIEDFYAHSNWVELGVASGKSIDEYAELKLWTKEGQDTVLQRANGHELNSGYSEMTFPKNCPTKSPTHGDLGKESSDKPPGSNKTQSDKWCNLNYYDAAKRLATVATIRYFQDIYQRFPKLAAYCDTNVAKLDTALKALHGCVSASPQ